MALYIPAGGSVNVYYDLALSNQANSTDAVANGIVNYYIVYEDNSSPFPCTSQIKIGKTIQSISPADPTPPSTQEFCSDSNATIGDLDPGTTATYIWYSNIDAFGNPSSPPLLDSTPLTNGGTYYVQIDEPLCDSNAIPVTVTINDPFDHGTPGNLEYCNDNVPTTDFNLFDELGAPKDANGAWTNDASLTTTNGNLGTVNISTLTIPGVYTFTYTVPANGACPESSADVTITINETFSSGTVSASNPAAYCEQDLPTAFDLSTLLDNEDPGGQWTEGLTSSGLIVSSPIDLTGLAPGNYNFTYTQNILPNPCPEESTTVEIIVYPTPETGTPTTAVFCENDLVGNSPLDLFGQLTGEDAGGTWADDDATGALTGSDVNITLLTIGSYNFTYSITDTNGCSNSSTVVITIEDAPESGNAIAPFEVCEESLGANSPYDLFSLLDGTQDTNGTWYIGPDTSGTVTTSSTDISALTAGTYDYTYSVPDIGTCSDVDVTVQIIVYPTPETGTATTAVFCENDLVGNSPLDLFGQLTGEDAGGTWADDDATGALTGSDVDLTLLTIGSYNFTYSITDTNGCSNSSTVIVTIEDAPESGTANSPAEFCLSEITVGQTYNLFDLLENEDQTGTWNDDDASGALSGNTVTLDGLAQGTYNFTFDVDAIGTCDDVDVMVTIIINDTPAPKAATPQEFCDTATIADLIITGNSIQWYDDSIGGTPLAGTTALVDGETYYATQTDATTGCESSLRTEVIATVYISPNAGSPNVTPIAACNTDSSIDLDTGLDGTQDAGGVWQDTDATGALTGNIFDATGLSAGTYQFTYYVTASAPCADDNTLITVTIDEPLNAGTDNALDVCSNNGTTDLFTLLGGADTGGIWSLALDSGTGVFDPLIDAQGTYTYTLTNACGTTSSDVVVSVTQAPNAGTDDSVLICVIDGVTDLFPLLGTSAQSGGTWSPALPSGTGEFDPNSDAAGVYTYTVTAVSPCTTDASASITVTVDDSTAPVVVISNPEYCLVDNPTVSDLDDALTLTGTVTWYEDAGLTILANATDSLLDGEDYYATQTNSSGCESSTNVQVTVTVNDTPTPTLITSNQELCINDSPTINELTLNITEFNASSNNVIWYDNDVGGSVVSDSSLLNNGTTYYAALIDATTGCESSTRLAVTPDLTSCGKLAIPDGFSPNGDGINDTFDMDNLGIIHPNFEIEIYNRYGNIVYKGNANTPRFNGKSNQSRTVSSDDLPVGVYFYIFKYNDGENKTEQGRLYLSR